MWCSPKIQIRRPQQQVQPRNQKVQLKASAPQKFASSASELWITGTKSPRFSSLVVRSPLSVTIPSRNLFGGKDKAPETAEEHYKRLEEWNAKGAWHKTVSSFETASSPRNEDCVKPYIQALSKAEPEKYSNLDLNLLMQSVKHEKSDSHSSGSTGNTNQSTTNSGLPPKFTISFDKWGKFAIVSIVGLVVVAVGVMVLGSTKEDDKKSSLNVPVSNAHQKALDVKERFEDVKGIDEVRRQLEEIVDYLRNPSKYTALGARLPRGILLTGEPGTGKTLLARAIAGEAGVPFFFCSGSSFDEVFVGVGPKRVRALFEEARREGPCIIFIDEIDAMGMARRYSFSSSYAKESTLNQLLTELDGFKQNEGIIIIGATNIPEALDSALTRPGRFDKQIAVPMPDLKARQQILELYLSKIKKQNDISSEKIAKRTVGFSGADLFNLVNQAAIKAATQNLSGIDMHVVEESLDEIIMGIRHKNLTMNSKEREKTAYHEAGHTLLQIYTEGASPLYKVTIIPRGQALGVTVGVQETDRVSQSKKEMKAHMAVCMGGKIAEELIFGENEVTGGCSSDLRQATNVARAMITHYGMSDKLGQVYYSGIGNGKFKEEKNFSESTLKIIDDEVIQLTNDAYHYAKDLLVSKEQELHRLAKALLEFETLNVDEVKKVISGQSINPPTRRPESSNGSGNTIVAPPTHTLLNENNNNNKFDD